MTVEQERLALPTPDARCGTKAGYSAHRRRGEHACGACRAGNAEASRERRRAATPAAKRPTRHPSCGTASGAGRHAGRGERLCEPCRAARRREKEAALPVPAVRPPLPDRRAFDGAACFPWTGSHDSRRTGESDEAWKARRAAARRVCAHCPAYAACEQLRDHYQGRVKGVDGILAGQPTHPKETP